MTNKGYKVHATTYNGASERINTVGKSAGKPFKDGKEVKNEADIQDKAYDRVMDGIIEAFREIGNATIEAELSMRDAHDDHSAQRLRELKYNMKQLKEVTASVADFSINEIDKYLKYN